MPVYVHKWDAYRKNSSFQDKRTKSAEYRYYEDFLVVYDRGGSIMELRTLSRQGTVTQAGNVMKDMNDVKGKLGEHYTVQSYDTSQGLKARVYYDKDNRVRASFVYSKNAPGELVWSILEKY